MGGGSYSPLHQDVEGEGERRREDQAITLKMD